MIRAGELNRMITFRRKTISYNSLNEQVESWADAATVAAGVMTTGGREFYAAQKVNAETSAVFKIRFNRFVNAMMRVKYENRVYEIIPPINDVGGKHTELLISAKEVV